MNQKSKNLISVSSLSYFRIAKSFNLKKLKEAAPNPFKAMEYVQNTISKEEVDYISDNNSGRTVISLGQYLATQINDIYKVVEILKDSDNIYYSEISLLQIFDSESGPLKGGSIVKTTLREADSMKWLSESDVEYIINEFNEFNNEKKSIEENVFNLKKKQEEKQRQLAVQRQKKQEKKLKDQELRKKMKGK